MGRPLTSSQGALSAAEQSEAHRGVGRGQKYQAAELLDDLLQALSDASQQLSESAPYFLGSIVLIKNEALPDAKVVDGHQCGIHLQSFAALIFITRLMTEHHAPPGLGGVFLAPSGSRRTCRRGSRLKFGRSAPQSWGQSCGAPERGVHSSQVGDTLAIDTSPLGRRTWNLSSS